MVFVDPLLSLLLAAPASPALPWPEIPSIPADFMVRYEWKEASVPPPHHYELAIIIGPGPEGRIEFWPDYPSADTPCWSEPFALTNDALAALHDRLSATTLPPDDPAAGEPQPSIGGRLEHLEVTAHGETRELPGEQTQRFVAVRHTLRQLVPRAVWELLRARRQHYIDTYPSSTDDSPDLH